jgi:hypothetical protein
MFYMIYKPLQEKLITALSRITDDWENKKNWNSAFITDLRKNNLILKAWNDKSLSDDDFMNKAFNTFIEWSNSLEEDKEENENPIQSTRDEYKNLINKYSSSDFEPKTVYTDPNNKINNNFHDSEND